MNHHTGGLVHYQQIVIFVDYPERYRGPREGSAVPFQGMVWLSAGRRFRGKHVDPHAFFESQASLGRFSIDVDALRLNGGPDASSRYAREGSGQGVIKSLAS
jgi:hypothetical protein